MTMWAEAMMVEMTTRTKSTVCMTTWTKYMIMWIANHWWHKNSAFPSQATTHRIENEYAKTVTTEEIKESIYRSIDYFNVLFLFLFRSFISFMTTVTSMLWFVIKISYDVFLRQMRVNSGTEIKFGSMHILVYMYGKPKEFY
jgi:hypothetical protein